MAWGHPLLPHQAEPVLGVEGVEVDDPASAVEIGEDVGHAGNVVRRDSHEGGVAGVGRSVLHGAQDVAGQVAGRRTTALGSEVVPLV